MWRRSNCATCTLSEFCSLNSVIDETFTCSLTKTKSVSDAECAETRGLIVERVPALLTCLGHPSVLVSQSVTDSARDYVQLLKLCKQQMKVLDAQQTEHFQVESSSSLYF